MRKSLWLGMAFAALLAGCASKGIYESDNVVKETFTVNTNYEAAFRRAGEYVRACHVQVQHAYNVAYAWRHVKGEKGAPDEVQLYKVTEPAKVLELIAAESDTPSTSKVTITVLGEGRWDAAEIAAAKASIQSATPVCRKGGEGLIPMDPRAQQIRAYGLSFALLAGAFRFLGWLNGGAALILTGFSLGVVGGDIAPPDVQLPLVLLLGGLLAACLGVLFAYLAQVSLLRQGYTGHLTRAHWPAQILGMLCYLLSALAFCAACWTAVGQSVTDTPLTTAYARR